MYARAASLALPVPARGGAAAARVAPAAALVLRLQRTAGNRATARLLARQPTTATRPHVLKDAGVTTTTRVNDKTRGLIDRALAESEKLRPYLKGKLPTAAKGGFEVHSNEDDFNQAY